VAQSLADVTILHFTSQLGAVDEVVAAMRKLLVLCFGVLKTGKPFDPANSDGLLSHIQASIAWRPSVGGGGGGQAPQPEGARDSARA
jgi:hypothetical protein